MNDPGTTGQDLISRVLTPSAPGGTVTPSQVGKLTALQEMRNVLRDARIAMGLLLPDGSIHRRIVAPSTGTDRSLDDAFLRLLRDHPEIGADSVNRDAFAGLVDLSAGLSSVDVATVPLAWALIAGVLCFDRDNVRRNRKILMLLSKGLLTELAPGVTVRRARVMLGDALKAAARQKAREQARLKRHSQDRGQVNQQLGQAKAGLTDHQKVRQVKKLAKDGQEPPMPPPAPKANPKAKTKGKTS